MTDFNCKFWQRYTINCRYSGQPWDRQLLSVIVSVRKKENEIMQFKQQCWTGDITCFKNQTSAMHTHPKGPHILSVARLDINLATSCWFLINSVMFTMISKQLGETTKAQ